MIDSLLPSRRRFLGRLALGSAFFAVPGLFAEELTRTPKQTEGPFYPDRIPLDTDNDLIVVNDRLTPAVGEITHLTGKILDAKGSPIRNAVVEIWQVDNNGAYIHSRSGNREKRDKNFQGFGRFLTGLKGEYYFRTIKPVPYPGRTPHIHFAVKVPGQEWFITQMYVKGESRNDKDQLFRRIRNKAQQDSLLVQFDPLKNSKAGELQANFDIVLGYTPKDEETKKP